MFIHQTVRRNRSEFKIKKSQKYLEFSIEYVGICIGCHPTNRGFSHCPSIVGRQRRSPTLVYAISASGRIPRGIPCRKQDNYISTGVCRCSILDCNKKFCENFKWPRISADKRFSLCLCFPPSSPQPGLLCGLRLKDKNYFSSYIKIEVKLSAGSSGDPALSIITKL